jgi:hypothetical protein
MNVAHSHNLPYSRGSNVVVCYGSMVGGSNERRKSLGPILLPPESSSYFKIILCFSYSLKRHLNVFIMLRIESEVLLFIS